MSSPRYRPQRYVPHRPKSRPARFASSIDFEAPPSTRVMLPCPSCGNEYLADLNDLGEPCFKCWRAAHPFDGVTNARMDAASDDSTDPRRQRDGTSGYNMGMPPVSTVVGQRPDGSPALAARPMLNSEVGSNRRRLELARRAGMEPAERAVYRSVR